MFACLFFHFMCLGVFACMYVCAACFQLGKKRLRGPLVLELQKVVSHVCAANGIQGLWKSGLCSQPLSHLSCLSSDFETVAEEPSR